MSDRLKICIVTSDIHYPGVQKFISGIISITESKKYEIVIIADSGLRDNRVYSEYKTTFYQEVFTYNKFVGVIAYTGTMNNYYSIEEISELLSYIPKNTPIVTASVKVDNYKVIKTDDSIVIKDLVSHIIKKHNKKRLMFIGPRNQQESKDRFKGFKEALNENNIEILEELLFYGMYTSRTGVEAIKNIVNKNIKLPDAIICANDEIALGVYSELKNNSIDFSNISITGFDNKEYTRDMDPSLSTVDQNFFNKGRAALDTLLNEIEDKDKSITNFQSLIVYRRSCGCEDINSLDLILNSTSDITNYIINSLNQVDINSLEKDIGYLTELLINYSESNSINLKEELNSIILNYSTNENDLLIIMEVLNILSSKYIDNFNKRKLIEYYKIMEEARINIHKNICDIKTRQNSDLNNKNSEIDHFLIRMASAMNYREFKNCLDENFYYLGIKSIVLFFPETSNPSLKKISGNYFYKSDNLNLTKQEYCNIILPITALDDNGYCILTAQPNSFHFGEVLSFQISKTLYSIELINNLNDNVKNIDKSYKDLRTTKDLLLKNEKLANLGGLVGGFTHEINTPIGIGVTAISYLEEETRSIYQNLSDGTLRKSQMEDYLKTTEDSVQIISKNLERAASLIRGFKQISVDQASDISREFNLKTYLYEVVSSLSPVLKKGNHSIQIDSPDNIEILSYPGVISQIITNLVQNSVFHGFENIKNGKIIIDVTQVENSIQIIYRDNGLGIDKKHQNQIFNQYYSTKIGQGGSGLGLSIIKKLVKSKLNGNITYNSSYSDGAEFILKFPKEPLK